MTNNVVQFSEKYKKNIAMDMRRRGSSYSEIQKKLHIAKSTLSFWLKNLELTDDQMERLKNRRLETARANFQKRISQTQEEIQKIKMGSARDIGKINKRELWLMGIILYWKHKLPLDIKQGIRFSSTNGGELKFFIKWLKEVGRIEDKEIYFDVFTSKKNKRDKNSMANLLEYWHKNTGFPRASFTHVYYQGKSRGFIRVRVRGSSMLARQIDGWLSGILKQVGLSPDDGSKDIKFINVSK